MAFYKFDFNKEIDSLIDYIFSVCNEAALNGYDGFREKGFDKIDSRYFSFVFLCGGDTNFHNSREVIKDVLKDNRSIKFIVAEKLDRYRGQLDLLTFESLLEAFSRMIIISIESMGTACELGAFTRIDPENNKVVAILNKKKAPDKSFINNGPIQYLKNLGDDRVIEASFRKIGEKNYLVRNSKIKNLINNHLLTDEIKIKKYFKEESGKKTIINLASFLTAVLDLICLLGFINRKIVEKFFSKFLNDNNFCIRSSTINCNHELTMNLVDSLIDIYADLGFLSKVGNVFEIDSHEIQKGVSKGNRWIGNILFTKKFTRSNEYLLIKARCVSLGRKIKKYGVA